jgi:hypothetical protein
MTKFLGNQESHSDTKKIAAKGLNLKYWRSLQKNKILS